MWKLSIDLGSSMTKIYRADTNSGVVLAEPSCVAVAGEGQEIKAIGKDAKNLIGKTAEYTSIIYPIYEGEIVDMRVAAAMLKEQILQVLNTLTPREEKVLRLRYGIEKDNEIGTPRTLEEVGKVFNVTRERIRQIEAKALRKLRHPSRSKKLKDFLD